MRLRKWVMHHWQRTSSGGIDSRGKGVAAKVLEKNGVTVEKVKDKINEYIGIGVSLHSRPDFRYTAFKIVFLEMSALEARRLNHSYIGTEHLLMAIIRDGDGVAAKILESLGVNLRISIRIQSVQ